MMLRFLLIGWLAASSTGCAKDWNRLEDPNARGLKQLQTRASFDMNCPKRELRIVPLEKAHDGVVLSYGVRGCGERTTYVLNVGTGSWVLNSVDRPSE